MAGVRYDVVDRIAEITLDAPPMNTLTLDMLGEIVAAFRRAGADEAVRAVILRSAAQKTFSAGLDLDAVVKGDRGLHVHKLLEKLYIELADAQYNLGKPSIAAVHGAARGGGMTLAISCNMTIAAETATFGYPEIKVGLLPAIHFIHLPRIVGRHRAFDLLFTGRSFSAAEAAGLGLVARVVPEPELGAAAREVARGFAALSPLVMRFAHGAFMRFNDYRPEIGHVTESFCTVAATEDAREGLNAFLDKRPPRW
jgi:enoyl-CoA hydratase/carnithine racemase